MTTIQLDEEHAMVVLSGGQDSTTCLGHALNEYGKVSCVTFDYGQTHSIELEAARNVVSFFSRRWAKPIAHEIVKMGEGIFAGTSPLTNRDATLETYSDHKSMVEQVGQRVESTFVPMRNAVFLMLAANRAAVAGAATLITGVSHEDSANYPDCRRPFIESATSAINRALGLASFGGIYIETPLINLTKAESIDLAMHLPYTYEALKYSHTAYDGKYPPVGKDHASVLRAHGFEEAGVPDPLVLRAWSEKLMELPDTPNYEGAQEFLAEFENQPQFKF